MDCGHYRLHTWIACSVHDGERCFFHNESDVHSARDESLYKMGRRAMHWGEMMLFVVAFFGLLYMIIRILPIPKTKLKSDCDFDDFDLIMLLPSIILSYISSVYQERM